MNRVINHQTCATIFVEINMFAGHYFTIKTFEQKYFHKLEIYMYMIPL